MLEWGRRHLELPSEREDSWFCGAWWGLAAGEVMRAHLRDPARRSSALQLINPVDWGEFEEARQHSGVILAAAHIGPPKTAMNYLLDKHLPLLIWTNKQDLPPWLEQEFNTIFLDPLVASKRSELLVRSALHLRNGGVLFGAPDWASGTQIFSFERLAASWSFSLGIPTLARKFGLPVFRLLALWQGNRISMECKQLTSPPMYLPDDEWNARWIETYWAGIERVIRTSPENLRFLRSVDGGAIIKEIGL